jgi:hypothetical protein
VHGDGDNQDGALRLAESLGSRVIRENHDPITIEPADCRLAAKTGRFKLHGKEHPFEMNIRQGVTVDLVGGLDN